MGGGWPGSAPPTSLTSARPTARTCPNNPPRGCSPAPPRPGCGTRWARCAAARGFSVERGNCGQANGYTHFGDRRIRVRADVDPAQAVKTLAHELGHVLIHDPAAFAGTTAGCRGTVEVEAESVAYLVAGDAGLDAAAYSFPYVAHWAGGVDGRRPEDVVTATADRVLHATRVIVDSWQPPATPTAAAAAALTAGHAQAGRERSREVGRTAARLQRAATVLAGDQAAAATQQRALLAVCAAAADFYTDQLVGSFVPGYLGARGLAAVLTGDAPYLIGYAPAGWTGLVDQLRGDGHTDAAIVDAGLALRTRRGSLVDRFRDRMMLAVRAEDGAVAAFIGRANPHTARGDTPKYLNCPQTAVYRKGDVLFGLAEARAALAGPHRPVLVEGAVDALAVWAATGGAVPVVAPSGTALTGGHVDALTRHVDFRERGIVVAFDADLGGRLGATRAFDALRAATDRILAADLPAGCDPAGLYEQEGPHRLAAAPSPSGCTPSPTTSSPPGSTNSVSTTPISSNGATPPCATSPRWWPDWPPTTSAARSWRSRNASTWVSTPSPQRSPTRSPRRRTRGGEWRPGTAGPTSPAPSRVRPRAGSTMRRPARSR